METSVDANALVREVTVDASPETIFEFLVDPAKMIRWMGTQADLKAQVGGMFSVDVTHQALARGSYVEIVPDKRVVFTFGWEGSPLPPGSTTVAIDLIPDGSVTVVRLTHGGLPNDEARAEHSHGWEHYLARLAVAATGGDPGPDPNLTT